MKTFLMMMNLKTSKTYNLIYKSNNPKLDSIQNLHKLLSMNKSSLTTLHLKHQEDPLRHMLFLRIRKNLAHVRNQDVLKNTVNVLSQDKCAERTVIVLGAKILILLI